MHRLVRTSSFIVATALAVATPAAADVVADWNICAPGIIATGRAAVQFGAGPATQLDLAAVHLAMHDAIQAYDRRFEPYAGAINPGGGSAIAAAARAAHTVLVTKFPPAQFPTLQATIDACYTTSMMGVVLSPADLAASNTVGNAAASNVLFSRNGDGSYPNPATPFPPTGSTPGPGDWRPNPGTVSMNAPWGGSVRPFAIESVERCQADDVPLMTSLEYAEAYNEVKALGSATNSARTPEQGRIARMFSGNFPGQYNRLLRDLAVAYLAGNTTANLGDRARLFALVNTAMADAFICSWNSKTKFGFWRPIHAIQNGDKDGNVLTEKDAAWTPYFLTITPT